MKEQLPRPPKFDDGVAYALVDTGALVPLGGCPELQGLHLASSETTLSDSKAKFRGIKASAEVRSLGLLRFQCAVGGVQVQLGFEATTEPIPLLLALPHLDGLGPIIDLPRRRIHMLNIGRYNIPLHVYGKGHLGLRLDDWNGDEGETEAPKALVGLTQMIEDKTTEMRGEKNASATKTMGKASRKWFEQEAKDIFTADIKMWYDLRRKEFPLEHGVRDFVGLTTPMGDLKSGIEDFERDEARVMKVSISEDALRNEEEPIGNFLDEITVMARNETRRASKQIWYEVLQERLEKGRPFLLELPHDADEEALGPLAQLFDDENLCYANSHEAKPGAQDALGRDFHESPERVWVSNSEELISAYLLNGQQGIKDTDVVDILAAKRTRRDSVGKEEEEEETALRAPREEEPAARRRRTTGSSSSASASSSTASSSNDAAAGPGFASRRYPPQDPAVEPCKSCQAERQGKSYTGPHSRIEGAGCRLQGVTFKRRAAGEPATAPAPRRQKVPFPGIFSRTSPARSSGPLFREPGGEPGGRPPEPAGEEEEGTEELPGEDAPMEEEGGSSSSTAPKPKEKEDESGEDPDREHDPNLPPDPGPDAKELQRRQQWKKIPLAVR